MKKIFLSVLAAGLLFTSCDMDKEPAGTLSDENGIQSVTDCRNYRNGFYTNLRALTGGAYIGYSALQMDEFFGTILNGNRHGPLSNGVILSGDSDFEGIWGGCYGAIVSVNFFLEKVQGIYDNPRTTDEERAQLDRYIGEAHFARAYYMYYLMDHFCNSWGNVDPNAEGTGLCITTVYNPTADNSTYIGRSSLAETFKFIEDEAKLAYDAMVEWEEHNGETIAPMAIYINSNVVKALQSRLALLKGDWETARTLANDLITDGAYTLASRSNYSRMWTDDTNNEIIFMPFASTSESAPSTGGLWISSDQNQADYIPTPYVVEHLYASNDVRKDVFIGQRDLIYESAKFVSPVFIKFPGSAALGGGVKLQNRPKPFRLSECYLIVAEASYELNDEPSANDALKTLRNARINRNRYTDYTGTELRDQIRLERQRELIGEGFRASDLRRWNLGFNRTDNTYSGTYSAAANLVVRAGLISYEAGDYRFVWPIPSSEIQVNPQMKGQQNPGY